MPTNYADPYPGRKGAERVVEECGKCSGTGRLSWTSVDDSRCWACKSMGHRTVLVSSVRARLRRQAKRAAEYADAAAKGAAERVTAEELVAERYPEIVHAAQTDDGSIAHRKHVHANGVIDAVRRDGVHGLESAAAEYRYRIGEAASCIRVNRYRGNCCKCREHVPADKGWVGETVVGWETYCLDHKPESY